MNAKNSVTVKESHIPFTLKTNGNKSIPALKNTNVLRNIITAATFPLEKAVNIVDEKMFIPLKKNEKAKIKNPFNAR